MLLSMSNHYQTCAARRQNGAGRTLTLESHPIHLIQLLSGRTLINERKKDGVAPSTINRTVTELLKRVLNWASGTRNGVGSAQDSLEKFEAERRWPARTRLVGC